MTPTELETRLAGRPLAGATVAALVDELRADPNWTVAELSVEQGAHPRLVEVELCYLPTGEGFILSPAAGSPGRALTPRSTAP